VIKQLGYEEMERILKLAQEVKWYIYKLGNS
jgi:hypothetical protein